MELGEPLNSNTDQQHLFPIESEIVSEHNEYDVGDSFMNRDRQQQARMRPSWRTIKFLSNSISENVPKQVVAIIIVIAILAVVTSATSLHLPAEKDVTPDDQDNVGVIYSEIDTANKLSPNSMPNNSPASSPLESNNGLIVGYLTVSDAGVAETLGRVLLEKHLVTSVNVIPSVTSLYKRGNSIKSSGSVLLMVSCSPSAAQLVASESQALAVTPQSMMFFTALSHPALSSPLSPPPSPSSFSPTSISDPLPAPVGAIPLLQGRESGRDRAKDDRSGDKTGDKLMAGNKDRGNSDKDAQSRDRKPVDRAGDKIGHDRIQRRTEDRASNIDDARSKGDGRGNDYEPVRVDPINYERVGIEKINNRIGRDSDELNTAIDKVSSPFSPKVNSPKLSSSSSNKLSLSSPELNSPSYNNDNKNARLASFNEAGVSNKFTVSSSLRELGNSDIYIGGYDEREKTAYVVDGKVDRPLQFTIKSNPSTGYTWVVDEHKTSDALQVSPITEKEGGGMGGRLTSRLGASKLYTFSVLSREEGTFTLSLMYIRLFDIEDNPVKKVVTINVKRH